MNPDPMGDNAFAVHTCDWCGLELDKDAIDCYFHGDTCYYCRHYLHCSTCSKQDCKHNTNPKFITE